MKVDLKKLNMDQVHILYKCVSHYRQYIDFFNQASPNQNDFIYLSILDDLIQKTEKKGVDLKYGDLDKTVKISLDQHSSLVLHSALLHYTGAYDENSLNELRKLTGHLNKQITDFFNINVSLINTEKA